jgi:putative transposase
MLLAHRIRLDPNNVQASYLTRAAGTARFAFNWGLAEWERQYQAWKVNSSLALPTEAALRRQLNAIKREQFPWMLEVTKNAPQMAIIQLGEAFKNFFAGRARYPRFRKKGVHDRFTLTNDKFAVDGRRIRIPKLGWMRMKEALRFTGRIISATISRVADRWFVSITVDTDDLSHLPAAENQGAVGVDLGVLALATLSTGEVIAGPKPHKALLGRLRRLSKGLSRKVKGSANRKKARAKLARLHSRIATIRSAALHRLTTDLTRRFHTIGIENLNVRRHAGQPFFGEFHCRHGLLRVSAAVGIQGRHARRTGGVGRPLLPQQQDVLGLRRQGRPVAAGLAQLDVLVLRQNARP